MKAASLGREGISFVEVIDADQLKRSEMSSFDALVVPGGDHFAMLDAIVLQAKKTFDSLFVMVEDTLVPVEVFS